MASLPDVVVNLPLHLSNSVLRAGWRRGPDLSSHRQRRRFVPAADTQAKGILYGAGADYVFDAPLFVAR